MIQKSIIAMLSTFWIALMALPDPLHASPSADNAPPGDTLSQKSSGLIFIPAIYYTPETRIAGGAAAIFYFRISGNAFDSRPSTISPTFIYTQRKQIISSLFAELYLKDELYRLNGGVSYMKYPDKFYGIGPSTLRSAEEDYTPRDLQLLASMQRKIKGGFSIGLQYQFTNTKLLEVEEDGLLAGGGIPGSEDGAVSSAGILANWDTRDNIFSPASGSFHQLSAILSKSALGSDYDFAQYNLDLRKYFPVSASGALATQFYMNSLSGEPPFRMLSKIGGASLLRGYYEGRYRDKHLLALQTEYRMAVWRRFGMVAFAGLGDVADRLDHFVLDRLKYSAGWGVRYLFSRREKLNIRIDLGFGEDAFGFYINLGEAF